MLTSLRDVSGIALASAVVCLGLGRPAIRWLARSGCVQPTRHEDCPPLLPYQAGKTGVPTMGGLLVLGVGMVMAILAGGLSGREGWVMLMAIIGLGAIGWWDDRLKLTHPNATGLRARPKLWLSLAVGAAVGWLLAAPGSSATILWVPGRSEPLALGSGIIPLAMVVMAGTSHAVNLTDGMDGLAVGCVTLTLAALGVWAWMALPGSPREILLPWCASLVGACVGFLWFNSFPASVFLGDVGALGLGGALAAASLIGGAAAWLVVLGGVFVAEAGSVMLQVASYRWRGGRRLFRVAPLHHHFHVGGLAEPKIVVRFWIIGLLLAWLAFGTVGGV